MNIEEATDNAKFVISDLKASNYNKTFIEAIETILTAYEKEKEKNKELYNPSDMILRYYDNGKGMKVEIKGFISKDKIKKIIYPTPENYISIEVQQSKMYKKLLKEVEE